MDTISAFTEFLLGKSFKLVGERKEHGVAIYEQDGFYVKIVRDTDGQHFIDLSRTDKDGWEGWTDMGVVRFFLLKQHYQKGGPTNFEELGQFFKDNYEEIRQAFSEANFIRTSAVLTELENERAKILFGYEEPRQN